MSGFPRYSGFGYATDGETKSRINEVKSTMNNINGINSYMSPHVLGAQQGKNVQSGQQTSSTSPKSDSVEISNMARLMSQVSAMPEIREEKVQAVREQLANGTYDIDGKLSIAIDRLLDEYA
ncbi:MAG: flagellar biosynthesis anti-sigma factor FlgM [Chitinivibrionales bacterium]|nr:flagellar biosynthesis anti-sigma factor FlgM [Chitinivibrionales bacterium]